MRRALLCLALATAPFLACGRSSLDTPFFEDGAGRPGAGAGGRTAATGGAAAGGSGGSSLPPAGAAGAGASPGGGAAGRPDAGSDAASSCGDGQLDPGESCDLGAGNQASPALELRQGSLRVAVTPLVTPGSVQALYAYESASSHTGFEELRASRLLVHRSRFDQAVGLLMHHGIDFDATGISQPPSDVRFTIGGLPTTSVVAVSDEADELAKTSAASASGDWRFNGNSDGGAIAGLPFPGNWQISVDPSFVASIDRWDFVDGDATFVGLATNAAVTLVAYDMPASCRLDCTLPACGDGVLDGGEVCDDGNLTSGDGCSGDCRPE